MTADPAAEAPAPRQTFRHLEDFLPGELLPLGELRLSREDIFAFARAFDPQPFHLDEAAADASLLGGLAASGWQTNVLLNRLLADRTLANSAFRGVRAVPAVKWLRPVRPDAPLAVIATVTAVRPPEAGAAAGVVTFRLRATDGAGDIATEMTLEALVAPLRPAEEPAS